MSNPARLERDEGLAVITFDSPPLNLFDARLEEGLRSTLTELEEQPPRAVLFRAEGRVVSGGVDVSVFAQQSGPDAATTTFDSLIEIEQRVGRLPCPTLFAARALW